MCQKKKREEENLLAMKVTSIRLDDYIKKNIERLITATRNNKQHKHQQNNIY